VISFPLFQRPWRRVRPGQPAPNVEQNAAIAADIRAARAPAPGGGLTTTAGG
jgi:hypothetical protein